MEPDEMEQPFNVQYSANWVSLGLLSGQTFFSGVQVFWLLGIAHGLRYQFKRALNFPLSGSKIVLSCLTRSLSETLKTRLYNELIWTVHI